LKTNCYPFTASRQNPLVIDWQPMIEQILCEIENEQLKGQIAMKFHLTLAGMILYVCKQFPLKKVVLTGGCFQNAILLEKTVNLLRENGYNPYWHQRVPPNDGGISLGQIAYLKFVKKHDREIKLAEPKMNFEKELK
jgi:hydrogenase maturation protein HypF